MKQDEIIEMAIQLGFDERLSNNWLVSEDQLMRFSKLVAAKEREVCALICAQRAKDFKDLLEKYGHEHDDGARVGASQCEQMIRAIGEA